MNVGKFHSSIRETKAIKGKYHEISRVKKYEVSVWNGLSQNTFHHIFLKPAVMRILSSKQKENRVSLETCWLCCPGNQVGNLHSPPYAQILVPHSSPAL